MAVVNRLLSGASMSHSLTGGPFCVNCSVSVSCIVVNHPDNTLTGISGAKWNPGTRVLPTVNKRAAQCLRISIDYVEPGFDT